MNRRHFFGMSAAAVLAAGLPAWVLPEKTLVLPPRFGWQPSKLATGYVREVALYVIDYDQIWYRYDVVGKDIYGAKHRFNVTATAPSLESATTLLEDRFAHEGIAFIAPHQDLPLPKGIIEARYV